MDTCQQIVCEHPVREAAAADMDDDLVRIDVGAIESLDLPDTLQDMGATLQGVLAQDVALYVPYFVAMDTMNFQFWDLDSQQQMVRYEHHGKVGALAMQEAFEFAWTAALPESGEPLTRSLEAAKILAALIEKRGVTPMFGDIPQAERRREILLSVLDPLRLEAASKHLIDCCRSGRLGFQSAQLLARNFPAAYADRYLKKAQLTLMFIAGQWNAAASYSLDLDVTAAADYQLPKVLRALEVLQYSGRLASLVDAGKLIDAESAEERAIRAATILACDRIAEASGRTIAQVDFWLWLKRNAAKDARFHLTRTTNY